MSDWEDFFKRHKDYVIHASYYESRSDFSLEDMYQAFKARMQQEARDASHPDPSCPARQGPASGCIC